MLYCAAVKRYDPETDLREALRAAAKAAYDLGLATHVIEFAPRLMPRQVDDAGSRVLVGKIEQLGVQVHLNRGTKAIHGDGRVQRMEFNDGESLDVDIIGQGHVSHVDLEHFDATLQRRSVHGNVAIETSRPKQGRVEHVRSVGGRHNDDGR